MPSIDLESLEDFFFHLVENGNAEITAYFGNRLLAKGDVLWQEGDTADRIAFIVSGRVELKKATEFPNKGVVVAVCGKGAIVGALDVLDGGPRAVTAEALEETALAVISREDFDRLLTDYPVYGMQLLKMILRSVASRLRKSYERLASFF